MDREHNTIKHIPIAPPCPVTLQLIQSPARCLFTVQPVWQVMVSYGVCSLLNVELFIYHYTFEIYCGY